MKVFSQRQIKELENYTIENKPIAAIDLMERAAKKVAATIIKHYDNSRGIIVFAGPGNNGGDALATARLLALENYKVEVYLFNPNDHLSADCEANKQRLDTLPNISFNEVTSKFEPPQLNNDDIIIDGLFGIGLNKPLSGGFAALVQFINTAAVEVIAIDMPSGLFCNDNSDNDKRNIIRATRTITFHSPKLSQLLVDNQEYIGKLEVVDIGLSEEKSKELYSDFEIVEAEQVAAMIKSRNAFGHKGRFGHALLIAGHYGMAGAAVLAAKASLRSGLGKLTLHTPIKNNDILQTAIPEAILSHDFSETIFTTAVSSDAYNAICLGPGLGKEPDTALAVLEQLQMSKKAPLVVDADALNILGEHKSWLQELPPATILTPHPAEFRRIQSGSTDAFTLLVDAQTLAQRLNIIVILKGHYTAICTPNGKTFFNPTGNSGMATAGSGDVLSGIITSLLAQQYSPIEASLLGVYLHGLAGDLAQADLEEECLIASDIIKYLPLAFKQLKYFHK
ncbi:NAD(P)H-hydrate dehydratase [Alloprevotella tannerae]|uniref:NAD(P)H-hydrate dehydratase n=1 Tax=Alloprevotella tannerae TaxID=76122 RepID=UPI001EDAAE3C|nr:NAD(P)H-hydrate dehydratase [Alloprevotella tannerae]MCG2648001.1 NAD(P)H-hydrate dehydratase [Alloprevotella tannerae]